ncbi:MAG: FAD binding domain-containing protein, partial [Chloroflexota bacterium]
MIEYKSVNKITEVLDLLAIHGSKAMIAAGCTDLMLEFEQDAHPEVTILIDISRIPGQDQISLDQEDMIHLGPMVTHNQCV